MKKRVQCVVMSWLAMWLLLVACTLTSRAHDLRFSSIKVRLDKSSVTVSVVAHAHSLNAALDPATELARRLQLQLDGAPFQADKVQLIKDTANGILIWQAVRQGAASRVQVTAPLFPENARESTILTVLKNRQVLGEALVNVQQPVAQIIAEEKSTASAVMLQFLREGMTHIFGGFDHVLFLLSLLLLGGTWKQLLKIVTAFTIAHSLTLSLAATGVFVPPARLIEPLIALSIVVVACLNLRGAEAENTTRFDARPWLALGFGLLHGFGFASALSQSGLPHESLGWALLSFNIGVEIGQAALVLLFAPALAWIIKKRPPLREPIVFYGSASVAAMGAFWLAQRLFTV